MTDENGGAATTENPSAPTPPLAPIVIEAQFVKDLSFENPQGIAGIAGSQKSPSVSIDLKTSSRPLAENSYEVSLVIRGEAKTEEHVIFIVETTYAGIFTLNDIPEESIKPVLLIEGPRMLFPFARSIVANAARDGGFPPLMINPIDFAALYHQQHGDPAAGQA